MEQINKSLRKERKGGRLIARTHARVCAGDKARVCAGNKARVCAGNKARVRGNLAIIPGEHLSLFVSPPGNI